MNCPDKVSLQEQVKHAWSTYETAAMESGYRMDPVSGALRPPSISEVVSLGLRLNAGPFASAMRLRGEHLKASRELSLHLTRHRC